jgi:hypothetical protein
MNQPQTCPVWLWGCSSCNILSPGPVFHGTKWLQWRPHIQSPTLHSRCEINKGLIKRGSTIIIEGHGARAGFYGPPLIHTCTYIMWYLMPPHTALCILKTTCHLHNSFGSNLRLTFQILCTLIGHSRIIFSGPGFDCNLYDWFLEVNKNVTQPVTCRQGKSQFLNDCMYRVCFRQWKMPEMKLILYKVYICVSCLSCRLQFSS